jgi:hypothetical protein
MSIIVAIIAAARLATLAVQTDTRADRRSSYITLQVSLLLLLLLRSALKPLPAMYLVVGTFIHAKVC